MHGWCATNLTSIVAMQGVREARTPFARIFEWLDIAETFVFEAPQVFHFPVACVSYVGFGNQIEFDICL